MAYCYLGARAKSGTEVRSSPFCGEHEILSSFNDLHAGRNDVQRWTQREARNDGNRIFAGAYPALLLGILIVATLILLVTTFGPTR